MTDFAYEYCRGADGTIGRRLLLPHAPLAVAGERYANDIGVWFLSPELSADVSGERHEAIEYESAADAVGEEALERAGEATSLADVEEPPPPNPRAKWLIERIAETQEHARREGESVGRALKGVKEDSPEWWSGMHRWRELCFAFGTLYSLWEELRLIQGHELQRDLESKLGLDRPGPPRPSAGNASSLAMAFTIDDARAYIAKVRWQFAKTMPEWPHEYTVRAWRHDLEREFFEFVELIRRDGIVKPWPPDVATPRYHHTYLELDGWEYWSMGAPVSETTVINRATAP